MGIPSTCETPFGQIKLLAAEPSKAHDPDDRNLSKGVLRTNVKPPIAVLHTHFTPLESLSRTPAFAEAPDGQSPVSGNRNPAPSHQPSKAHD